MFDKWRERRRERLRLAREKQEARERRFIELVHQRLPKWGGVLWAAQSDARDILEREEWKERFPEPPTAKAGGQDGQ